MIKAIVLFGLLASFAMESSATMTSGLKIKWGSYRQLPELQADAIEDGWVQVNCTSRYSGYSELVLWCPASDYSYCVWFDGTGYPAGVQLAIAVSNCTNVYDMADLGFRNWTTTIDGIEYTFYAISQYFMSTEYLATDLTTRKASRSTTGTIVDDLYLEGFGGQIMKVSSNITDMKNGNTEWTKQRCIWTMGTHYYYNMSSATVCSSTTLNPWFPLVVGDQLVGVGCVLFCKVVTTTFETPGETAVKVIVKDGPQCLYDMADTSIMTMHTYFVKHPLLILSC